MQDSEVGSVITAWSSRKLSHPVGSSNLWTFQPTLLWYFWFFLVKKLHLGKALLVNVLESCLSCWPKSWGSALLPLVFLCHDIFSGPRQNLSQLCSPYWVFFSRIPAWQDIRRIHSWLKSAFWVHFPFGHVTVCYIQFRRGLHGPQLRGLKVFAWSLKWPPACHTLFFILLQQCPLTSLSGRTHCRDVVSNAVTFFVIVIFFFFLLQNFYGRKYLKPVMQRCWNLRFSTYT